MVILSKGAGAKRTLLRRGGTPGETRTHYIPLRRRTLYPGEVQGHVLNFPRMEDGLLILRRRTLYNIVADAGVPVKHPAKKQGEIRYDKVAS